MSTNPNDIFSAYGTDRRGLETVMRLHAVKRWHMIDTTRQQTLAEHSANVALLTYFIAKTSPINHFDNPMAVAVAALVHDAAEAFTGDIPSHTKRMIMGVDELERIVSSAIFDVEVGENSRILVKLCDLADGIRFVRLHGVDLTALHAREGLEEQLQKKYLVIKDIWPAELFDHVYEQIHFYAYEKR
jgi:hypothetical protein